MAVPPAVSAVAAALAAAAALVEEVGVAGLPREVVGVVLSAGGVVTVVVAGLVDRREGDLQEVVASKAGSKAASREEEEVGSHRWTVVAVVEADTALQVAVVVVVVGVVS